MNKVSFTYQLKQLRIQHQISQSELAHQLSLTHRAFKGVNQVMISQWEKGKAMPSFVRRMGIVSYFGLEYKYDLEEITSIKTLVKLENSPINYDAIYKLDITNVCEHDFINLPKVDIEVICKVHNKFYGGSLLSDISLISNNPNNLNIYLFKSGHVKIGHVIIDEHKNIVISIGALDWTTRKKIIHYLGQKFKNESLVLPISDPAICQLLYDIYQEPVFKLRKVAFVKVELEQALKNNFINSALEVKNRSFIYLRYNELRLKKKNCDRNLTSNLIGRPWIIN